MDFWKKIGPEIGIQAASSSESRPAAGSDPGVQTRKDKLTLYMVYCGKKIGFL